MDIDSAAVFLAGSILYSIGCIVILIGIVVANNIIHKYWKSLEWSWMPHWAQDTPRFASKEELDRIAPEINNTKK